MGKIKDKGQKSQVSGKVYVSIIIIRRVRKKVNKNIRHWRILHGLLRN